ncbi:dual specificity testis-specific protein kinase 2-like [Acropora millepora]|uniref:dual specificity testis-specific protein kinase 2-like n=1 Tax=Acropora millepora TaxID=45264 RepID=UPI001CF4C75A|nr:dual specificity testis-specific protein kinase 2-like [Acropora millepora]
MPKKIVNTRLNIKVVEKQSLLYDTKEILKEAQIMQALSHKNIPTILGVQIQKSPMSLVIEFIGEHDTSITLSKLLSCDNYQEAVKNLQNLLTNNDWLIISHNLAEALSHIHSKGFLHCDDLKSNNVLESNRNGYIIDFGKACHSSFPPAKKYSISYSHIAPEVLKGSPSSKASDIFSLGKILYKVGTRFEIPILVSTA